MNNYKKVFLPLALYMSTSLAAFAMPPDPLLHYDFDAVSIKSDNIVRDSSGNNLHAVFAETDTYTAPKQTVGYKGSGLTFDGTGLLRIGDNNLLDLNTYTAMAWVRYQDFAANDGRQEIYEKANSYWMNIRKNSRRLRVGGIFGACKGANRKWFFLDSLSIIPKNVWTHVAARYNGGSLTIYINGQLDAQAPISGRVCDSDQPLILAAKHQLETLDTEELVLEKPEAFLKGTLDEFRLYTQALSQSQIQQVMNPVAGLNLAVTISAPAKNASVRAPVNITGSATAPARVSQVVVGIKDNVTNKWWRNGSWGAWQLNPATLNFTNSNQTRANFSLSFDPRGSSGSGNYWVVVRTIDSNGARSDPKSLNFTVSNN